MYNKCWSQTHGQLVCKKNVSKHNWRPRLYTVFQIGGGGKGRDIELKQQDQKKKKRHVGCTHDSFSGGLGFRGSNENGFGKKSTSGRGFRGTRGWLGSRDYTTRAFTRAQIRTRRHVLRAVLSPLTAVKPVFTLNFHYYLLTPCLLDKRNRSRIYRHGRMHFPILYVRARRIYRAPYQDLHRTISPEAKQETIEIRPRTLILQRFDD